MNKLLFVVAIVLTGNLAWSNSAYHDSNSRAFDNSIYQNSCAMELGISNYGVIGKSLYPSLILPDNSDTKYLYAGSLWVGGKKYRRNAAGQKLYWLAQVPSADSSQVIAEGETGWHSYMSPVVDTLTSQGFDGDKDLNELLPAYNPLMSGNTNVEALYNQYNTQDIVLKSILSYPNHLTFSYPDPSGAYCFTIPQNETGNEPGFETCSAYYYDFCPFGTGGERDWGSDRASSRHVPLGLAVEQKSYAWPLQNYEKMVIFKYTIHNTSVIDTLFDTCAAYYLDCDIGPNTLGPSAAIDDQSGYVMGANYEFGYSKDNDGDSGLSPYLIGCKLMLPDQDLNRSSCYWRVGDGPDDFSPQSLNIGAKLTANEKYWLMTGRNLNPGPNTKYPKLRGGPDGNTMEYIQPDARDTRFLHSFYGNLPTIANPNPQGRINLAPQESISLYMAIFANTSLDGLKNQAALIENLINNNLNIGNTTGLASIPYMTFLQQVTSSTIQLNWFSYTNPDHFEMMYKPVDAPASQWQSLSEPGTARMGQIEGLMDLQRYKFKVASIFNPGPNEVYLESQTLEITVDNHQPNEDDYITPSSVMNYPNPFNAQMGTTFRFNAHKSENFQLLIYNVKGQKIKTFTQPFIQDSIGYISWFGEDDSDTPVANGVYYYVLKSSQAETSGKVLLIK